MSETRRHSTRNRGEPPARLRQVSPEPVKTEPSPVTSGRRPGPGRPRKSETIDTPSKLPKTKSTSKAKDSPKPATPAPEEVLQPDLVEDMSTLIARSRQRWLNDGGVFERFWQRPPRKKKNQPAPEGFKSKAELNMHELGPARLIIEPHVFDITVYGVKKPALSWQPPLETSKTNGVQPPANATNVKPVPQNPYVRPPAGTPATPQTVNQRGIAPNPYAMPTQASPAPTQQTPRPSATPSATNSTPVPVAPQPVTAPQRPPQPPASTPQPAPQQSAAPHPDPVIQMLAQRAAGDPALKELMKVVAAGSESPEKLAEFQRHINEITEIVKQAQAKGIKPGLPAQPIQQQQPAAKQQYRAPQYIQSKPMAQPRMDFSQLAFDFVRQGDCYLLPKQSIVQNQADKTTSLISFIFTRKGKDVQPTPGGSKLKPEVEYYQPITVTLLTMDHKIRDALSQAVGDKEQVSKEMSSTMERCTLAPDFAAMLEAASQPTSGVKRNADGVEKPRDAGNGTTPMDVDRETGPVEDDVLRAEWDAPDSLLPM